MKPPHKLIVELQARYGEPQRHYHTWDHIEALLAHYETIEQNLHDPVSTLWALYWHDAIYDPNRPDNEDASAELLVGDAAELLNDLSLKRADRIIRATKQHLVPSDISESDRHDLQIFLDIDLSILGARDDVFDTYEENIRKEYAFVPNEVYTQARSSILSGFLKRERLYFSDHFFKLWEHKARANLERSIARLAA